MTCANLSPQELLELELSTRLELKQVRRRRDSLGEPKPLSEGIDNTIAEHSKLSDAIEELEEKYLHYIDETDRRKLRRLPTPE